LDIVAVLHNSRLVHSQSLTCRSVGLQKLSVCGFNPRSLLRPLSAMEKLHEENNSIPRLASQRRPAASRLE